MPFSKFEKIVLIAGTIISILIGVTSGIYTTPSTGTLVTLLTECLTISLTVLLIVSGMRENILTSIKESTELLQVSEKLSIIEDNQFKEKYHELYRELLELSKGRYTINLRSDIYMDNIKSLDELQQH